MNQDQTTTPLQAAAAAFLAARLDMNNKYATYRQAMRAFYDAEVALLAEMENAPVEGAALIEGDHVLFAAEEHWDKKPGSKIEVHLLMRRIADGNEQG